MAIQLEPPTHKSQRVPLYRNVTFLKWAAQILFVVGLVLILGILAREAGQNLEDRDIPVNFDFLSNPPGIQLGEGIDTHPSTGARAFYVGIVNMLRVSVAGIIAATLLGVLLGIARLSSNWIVKKVATVYIETIRNIPLLVQIVFWGAVISAGLPNLGLASGPYGCDVPSPGCEGWLFVSNKGISFPWFFPSAGFWQWFAFLLVGIAVAVWVYRRRFRLKEEQGEETYAISWALGTVLLFAVVGWFAHPVMGFLGVLWGLLGDLVANTPVGVVQAVLAAASLLLAGLWIKRFLDSRRTPAGLAKLTDDDIFRLGAAAVAGVAGAIIFFVFSGIAGWIIDSGRDFFRVAEGRFEFGEWGEPFRFGRPNLIQAGNFPNYGRGGMTMSRLFFPVFVGVTIYTAAFIAEVVRGGILAISKGQTEAGFALGLRRSQLLRFIILPQAFRIILPPMGNQYLNLAKNTSLGIAVAYPEVVQVGQTIYNQSGATIPVVILWMLFYVSVSLFISAIVNMYNRRLRIVER